MSPGTAKTSARVEWLLTIPIAAGVAYTFIYLWLNGHLPGPYFYEPSGTFMDFAAPATFAHNGGAYDAFQSIYPPLTFVLLKYLSWGPCYAFNAAEAARDCDLYGVGSLLLIYAVNCWLVFRTYRKLDRCTAWPRTIALCAGLPMTYALERGNVLLFTFTCIILAYGPLVRSARLRWIFAALAVNFKVYLIGTIFAQLLKGRWRWFEGAMVATAIIYLLSYAWYGEGTPRVLFDNVAAFANSTTFAAGFKGPTLLDLWYPSSLLPMRQLLEGNAAFPIVQVLGSQTVAIATAAVYTLTATVTVAIIAAAAATWWRPHVVPMHRLIFLSIAIALINSEVGGYTQLLLIFFVLMERWRGFGRKSAIVMAYVLCIALDIPIEQVPPVVRDSYLSGREVIAQYHVGVGVFVRPVLVHLMILSLALVTIRDAWADARRSGWRSPLVRWRESAASELAN